ncbi:MAG: acyl-CoA dehydratase activase [Sphaerochaetaceae bacterium]|nr:acyl-CoA dehydratase activase [Sphaerochaetaceae bacterium]
MNHVGIDIGSTTIKVVVLDDEGKLISCAYERHYSEIVKKSEEMLNHIAPLIKNEKITLAISGSAGMGMAQACGIPFIQEVYATRTAVQKYIPNTDAVIELGGEDAKILFLTKGLEVRMNGSCAGGTGAFIDQMATLLGIGRDDIDYYAQRANKLYTIASRCGVFAKTDVQPLINQGAQTEDIAASILQAVVNQTVAGLSQGRKIQGNVVYLGGPLTFISTLRKLFDETLKTDGTLPENSLYYVAMGTALAKTGESFLLSEAIDKIKNNRGKGNYVTLPPLFENEEEYNAFIERHSKAKVKAIDPKAYHGKAYFGVDAGSTTIKVCLIDEEGNVLLTRYGTNNGNPIQAVKSFLNEFYEEYPYIQIAGAASTGYGEDLLKSAFRLDWGLVETQAHFKGARFFLPEVDFIIDIGGQDMKCFCIRDGAIDDIFLNEACSSGCGSFLQTFANALGKGVSEFAELALKAREPVDLGSRCTVFMNSSVKQAQKDGATVEDISAGLAISVVKNALYKVIRASSTESLGKNIVVQGGTFMNNAVLRAFEKEMGVDVIRPDIAGIMGAFGAALYAREKAKKLGQEQSTILSAEEVQELRHKVSTTNCGLCTNHCLLTINTFDGNRRLISGNRCEKPLSKKVRVSEDENIYAFKQQYFDAIMADEGEDINGTIGIPMALGMYELLPFWHAFWRELGYRVVCSGHSTRNLYVSGQGSIPSDTACFPAKLAHGHIEALLDKGVKKIWLPCSSYNVDEEKGNNHFNCPIVAYYGEVIRANQDLRGAEILDPFLSLEFPKYLEKRLSATLNLPRRKLRKPIEKAYEALDRYHKAVIDKGKQIVASANGRPIIVLAGRPYHIDHETNHGIDRLIAGLGALIISEDCLSYLETKKSVEVLNQWTYHARLYDAARYVTEHDNMNLVQFVSFGCGLDAVTTDEVRSILKEKDKIYTQIKIDEITNVGAVKIRLRSLFAALEERQ